jgi:hypothetical protein
MCGGGWGGPLVEGRDAATLDRGGFGGAAVCGGRKEGDGREVHGVGGDKAADFSDGNPVWGPQNTPKCLYCGQNFKPYKC